MPIYILLSLVIAFFAIAFALQNNTIITLNLLTFRLQGSLALVLLATLALGVIIGLLVTIPAVIKRDWRTSRVKKQAASLEAQLADKDRTLSDQSRQTDTVRQTYQTLLQALNLNEATTGFLHSNHLAPMVAALVQQMQQPQHPASVALLLVQARRSPNKKAPSTTTFADSDPQLWSAVATAIQRTITVDSWLYSDGAGQFMCTLTGFDLPTVTQYGERLQRSLTAEPLLLANGSQALMEVNIGGVVAERPYPVGTEQLLIDQAYQALAQAQQRGRNRLRIVSAAQ
jgi:GGDEF domain-containing protein/uncharacterized integral membrane protein